MTSLLHLSKAHCDPQILADGGAASASLDSPRAARTSPINNSYFRQKVSHLTPRSRSPTFAEIVNAGIEPGPWSRHHPHCLRNKYPQISFAEAVAYDRERQVLERQRAGTQYNRKRQEQRKVSRELDGAASTSPSPSLSRIGSSLVNTFTPFKRSDTSSSSINSGSSANSSASTRAGNRVSAPAWIRDLLLLTMIESFKDMKHGKTSSSYEGLKLERTASQILHHMEDKDTEDSLESTRARVLSNARAIYGANRLLDVISFAPSSSRRIVAAIVEHNPTSRSYIHCCSAKEKSRLAAVEHLLIITEDILHRMVDAEGITSSGWLPATAQAQHAATYNMSSVTGSSTVAGGSVAGSVPGSRRSSVAPQE
ncbi:hypothetical protein ACEQ8H_008275 [Pleosporales sp. CAS-2024a]